ncbi:MAG: hypothetical protein OCC45_07745 [Desulfotalea sp.]
MSSITSAANSALGAAGTSMAVSAHNVANINTDDFKRSRTIYNENENGGVKAVFDKVDISPEGLETGQPSSTEYAEEVVAQIGATNLYSANLTAIKTEDEMNETILNIKA